MKSILRICLAVLIAATSCTILDKGDYTNTVPDNASAIITLNAGSVLDKSEIQDSWELKRQLKKELKNSDSQALRDFVNNLSSEGLASSFGIDPFKPLIFALAQDDEGESALTVSMALSSEKKFREFLEKTESREKEVDGTSVFSLDDLGYMAVDRKSAVFTTSSKEYTASLLTKDTGNEMISKNVNHISINEMTAWVDFSKSDDLCDAIELLDMFTAREMKELREAADAISGMTRLANASLLFEEGKVTLCCSAKGVEENTSDNFSSIFSAPSEKWLEYVPKNADLVCNLNVAKIGDLPRETADILYNLIEENLGGVLTRDIVDEIGGDVLFAYDEEIDDALIMFEGPDELKDILVEYLGEDNVSCLDGHYFIYSSWFPNDMVERFSNNFTKNKAADEIAVHSGAVMDFKRISREEGFEYLKLKNISVIIAGDCMSFTTTANFDTHDNTLKLFTKLLDKNI